MKKLLITIAAAALVAVPLAAQAQDHDGWQGDGQGGHARPAASYGHQADARVRDNGRGGARYSRMDRQRLRARPPRPERTRPLRCEPVRRRPRLLP